MPGVGMSYRRRGYPFDGKWLLFLLRRRDAALGMSRMGMDGIYQRHAAADQRQILTFSSHNRAQLKISHHFALSGIREVFPPIFPKIGGNTSRMEGAHKYVSYNSKSSKRGGGGADSLTCTSRISWSRASRNEFLPKPSPSFVFRCPYHPNKTSVSIFFLSIIVLSNMAQPTSLAQKVFRWSNPYLTHGHIMERQSGYSPELSSCGIGTTCNSACGNGFVTCNANTNLALFCYNPSHGTDLLQQWRWP